MAAELIIAPEAEQDLAQAYAWYEGRRIGLGEDFLSCVDACIEAIRRTPEMHALVHESYRRGLVRRFPYAVFCEYVGGTVTVHGVFTPLTIPTNGVSVCLELVRSAANPSEASCGQEAHDYLGEQVRHVFARRYAHLSPVDSLGLMTAPRFRDQKRSESRQGPGPPPCSSVRSCDRSAQ
jgi:hypothetical protein